MEKAAGSKVVLHKEDEKLLAELRMMRRANRSVRPPQRKLTPGQRIADVVAATMGSWTFIIIQSVILMIWPSSVLATPHAVAIMSRRALECR